MFPGEGPVHREVLQLQGDVAVLAGHGLYERLSLLVKIINLSSVGPVRWPAAPSLPAQQSHHVWIGVVEDFVLTLEHHPASHVQQGLGEI